MAFLVATASVVAFVFFQLFGGQLRRSAISKRLKSGARQISDGASVTLTGTIRAINDDRLVGPLSGRTGIIVYAHAELPEVDGREGQPENVTLVTRTMLPFELETQDGIVRVDGSEMDLELEPQKVPSRSVEREQAFMKAHGRGVEAAKVATFRELVLTVGMRVAVHGKAIIETGDPNAERGYREAVSARTRVVALPSYRLTIGYPRHS